MHELSIASCIVDLAREEAEARGVRVLAVHLKLVRWRGWSGKRSSALRNGAAGTPLAESRLVIELSPIVIFCTPCNARRTVASPQSLCSRSVAPPRRKCWKATKLLVTALEGVDT